MTLSFTAEARDSLSNLAASLNTGRDKAASDAFFVFDLDRSQAEAMYRGDWLARKIVDIVPYDMAREWRVWSGDRADVAAAEAIERRFGVRKLIQRALTLGRLYGGAALVIGTGETDEASLAHNLYPEFIEPGGITFLHVVSRWQIVASTLNRDPLSPWFGEPEFYEILAPGRPALRLHPSRLIRVLGNELPDPSLGLSVWSDSVLQTLYDAVHAVALTTTGATSLMHEAKVDVVTVPNLSEHLSSSATTAQLSARFAYAAAMKSMNNLLLLGDGETWSRQKIDFSGIPEMVRTFLQVAAGAADIPVTRLLGQSPAGMSATGESDTRNYYDMIAARQEIDLHPKLERLDQLILRSAGLDPDALSFEFRPLWQMDAAASAAIALRKAQASQIYAGLNLWPASVSAKLVQAQLAEDGTYPGAVGMFAEAPPAPAQPTADALPVRPGFDPNQPRDPHGRWTEGEGGGETTSGEAAPNGAASAPPENAPTEEAPDGTPIEAAAFRKNRGRGQGLALATLLGAVGRFMRRWLPKLPDDDEPDLPPQPSPRDLPSSPSPRSFQTEKNKKAQSIDPRIRADLDDRFINDDGTLNWPENNGADGPETPLAFNQGRLSISMVIRTGNICRRQERHLTLDRCRMRKSKRLCKFIGSRRCSSCNKAGLRLGSISQAAACSFGLVTKSKNSLVKNILSRWRSINEYVGS